MKKSLIALAILAACTALQGCTSIDNAGSTGYDVQPVLLTSADGKTSTTRCRLVAKDGKEYAGRAIAFTTNGEGCALEVQEGESKAFAGQALAVKAATILPVTGLQAIVPAAAAPVPK